MTLAGCSTLDAVNAIQPKGAVSVTRGQAYGDGPRQKIDIYTPRRMAAPSAVVVFFYGGGWETGDRADYAFVGAALAARGYVVMVPDYRLYPQVKWPAFLQDSAEAVRWAKGHAGDYGGDPQRVVLMGHSAGAYNAAMLALDDQWLNAVGLDPARDIAALVGLAGPYDFLPLRSETLKAVFGPEPSRAATQPINQTAQGAPPTWLGTGDADKVVLPRNTERLAAKLRASGVPVETRLYPRLGHALMVGAFAIPFRFTAPVMKDVVAFLDAQTAPTTRMNP
ncbi:alpha/beta hydrolase [Caulobacter sp. NIBR2454]|uniref:alpha/beta hydrolase n=1 Tax=Caulobacter sp. NIBR2454 TaxID=3015996 RepID=UPI0022B72203|nr:alpha/beta hydrolase [Caulobacter sp. NIBR2454]